MHKVISLTLRITLLAACIFVADTLESSRAYSGRGDLQDQRDDLYDQLQGGTIGHTKAQRHMEEDLENRKGCCEGCCCDGICYNSNSRYSYKKVCCLCVIIPGAIIAAVLLTQGSGGDGNGNNSTSAPSMTLATLEALKSYARP